jgi:transcriptional regulator with XRE-family HTH domain
MAVILRLGERLRKAREKLGIGLNEAAHRARISPSLLSRLENDERGDIRFTTAIRLYKALDVTLDHLAGFSPFRAR